MTTDSIPARGDPRLLLAHSRHLAHRVRLAQRVTWFPLLVLAAVTFAAIPVDRYGHRVVNCRAVGAGEMCEVWHTAAFVYWPLALLLAYMAIAGCYLLVARARGLGTRVLPYVLTGIALAALGTAVGLWVHYHPPTHWLTHPYNHLYGLVGPFGVLPHLVILGSVLLLGGLGFALAQRPWGHR